MRIVFMGTPHFAVPALQALIDHRELGEVVGVVTQPDAPAGRGNTLAQPPVKQLALQHGIAVQQPASLKDPSAFEALAALQPGLIVVAAFGQILRKNVLALPQHGCINVHGSLLPRWRGASPIHAAIAAGDAETGITIMQMDPGMDTGPMLSKAALPIGPTDTTGALTPRLAQLGADLLLRTLPDWVAGRITPQAQDNALATTCRMIKKEEGRIDWARSAVEIDRHIRAMSPWPGAFTSLEGRGFKIIEAVPVPQHAGAPGQVAVQGGAVLVGCGGGALALRVVQAEGKKAMEAAAFARGQRGFAGAVLGA